MTVIRTPQQYANRRMAELVRESFQTVGELCIFLKMYHAWVEDSEAESAHCPRCWDPFYKESTDMACSVCGGTGLSPNSTSRGVKQFGRAWCVVSDNTNNQEVLRKYGQWDQDDREMQLEGGIEPEDHDYVVRVLRWTADYRPLELGPRYKIDNPQPVSVRSGNEFGQSALNNVVGYKFRAQRLRDFQPVVKFDFPSTQPIPKFVL